ncbi:unnamed protein product [Dibothriocephalus latus]|uniref:Uncharacterized protein n=1 Tax=Dibothriocephalus latus TaxID=60516 RepID=A0A3P7PA61_DIBLA|nr:unnamed protein product [Dibothriocephalus latus]
MFLSNACLLFQLYAGSSDPVRPLPSGGDGGLFDTCATPTLAYSTGLFAVPTLGKVFFGAASTGTSGSTVGSGGLFGSASNTFVSNVFGLLGSSTGASSSGDLFSSTDSVSEGLVGAASGFGSPATFGSVNAAQANPLIFPIPSSPSAYTGSVGFPPVSRQSTSFGSSDAGGLSLGYVCFSHALSSSAFVEICNLVILTLTN